MISGATLVTGVAGRPVARSLSPLIHNAWIQAAGLDAVYVAFSPSLEGFRPFVQGCRGGALRGLNVTAPFKENALAAADCVTPQAERAGAANLLLFESDGKTLAHNTDGEGLLDAFKSQASGFDPKAGPVVVLGAGGAARGAIAAFLEAGAPSVVLFNRSMSRGRQLAELFGDRVSLGDLGEPDAELASANVIINATPTEPNIRLDAAPPNAIVMDMVYQPLATPFLNRAGDRGLRTVDGLAMLIGQARPSFKAFFGIEAPALDVRSRALGALASAI